MAALVAADSNNLPREGIMVAAKLGHTERAAVGPLAGHEPAPRIIDYPNLSNYLRQLYQVPGISDTVSLDHIKRH